MTSNSVNRRRFVRTCLSAATLVAANPRLLAQSRSAPRQYTRSLITDEENRPLDSSSFDSVGSFVFNYPYVTTPCFLIRLADPVTRQEELATAGEETYHWPGGIGPENRIVAFAAICAHKLSYPTRTTSFINFRPEPITYVGQDQSEISRQQMIYCCSERSVYDPARGARVLAGPAPQPLTAILLEHDPATDHYYATGTLGGELYDRFFSSFGFRVALEHGNENIRERTGDTVVAYPPDHYSANPVRC